MDDFVWKIQIHLSIVLVYQDADSGKVVKAQSKKYTPHPPHPRAGNSNAHAYNFLEAGEERII